MTNRAAGVPAIFISHSSHDAPLAAQIVDLLRAALNLPAKSIRCTSVDGTRLPGGAHTDQSLRQEITGAPLVIGLLSESALTSAYVLFELGARWGADRPIIPVLAPGFEPASLPGPLAGLNALRIDTAAELHQIIHDIAVALSLSPEPAPAFQRHMDAILHGVSPGIDARPVILLADDDLSTSSGLFVQFDEWFGKQNRIHLVNDVELACEELRKLNRVRLCVTDLVFRSHSELGGVVVAETALQKKIPVIVMTAHDVTTLHAALRELNKIGVARDAILTKPVTMRQYEAFKAKIDVVMLK